MIELKNNKPLHMESGYFKLFAPTEAQIKENTDSRKLVARVELISSTCIASARGEVSEGWIYDDNKMEIDSKDHPFAMSYAVLNKPPVAVHVKRCYWLDPQTKNLCYAHNVKSSWTEGENDDKKYYIHSKSEL